MILNSPSKTKYFQLRNWMGEMTECMNISCQLSGHPVHDFKMGFRSWNTDKSNSFLVFNCKRKGHCSIVRKNGDSFEKPLWSSFEAPFWCLNLTTQE